MPQLYEFFEEAMQQVDPAQEIDREYWSINDPTFCWQAARLLNRQRLHFAQENKAVQKSVPEYLEAAIKRLVSGTLGCEWTQGGEY